MPVTTTEYVPAGVPGMVVGGGVEVLPPPPQALIATVKAITTKNAE